MGVMEEAAAKAALRLLQPSPGMLGVSRKADPLSVLGRMLLAPIMNPEKEMTMAFLDFLTGKKDCPRCGTPGAKEIKGLVYCPNPTCSNFSENMSPNAGNAATASETFSQSADSFASSSGAWPARAMGGNFTIQYRDFKGQERTFVAQADSAHRVRNHINVKVAPKGRLITLSRDRILNRREVEAAFPQRVAPGQDWPSPRERQILNYHLKRHSTSRRFESVRAKYPNW